MLGRRTTRLISVLIPVGLFSAEPARGVPVLPSGAVGLSGTTLAARPDLAGTFLLDSVQDFEIQGAGGVLIYRGRLQNRLTRAIDGGLVFSYHIANTDPSLVGSVVRVDTEDFWPFTTDVDYRLDSSGSIGPERAFREPSGNVVAFDFGADPVPPGQESFFFFIKTNATAYELATGYTVIRLATGEQVVLDTAVPVRDCDGNGVPDLSQDTKGQGVPAGCGNCFSPLDESIDLTDYADFARCHTSPGSSAATDCVCSDSEGDGDVDIKDFSRLQLMLGRSQPPIKLVRGYIATAVEEPNTSGDFGQVSTHDVFLPNVEVFLSNVSTSDLGAPTTTDLSGGFTLGPRDPGRYRVCWKARGFADGCSESIVSVDNAHVHVGTIRVPADPQKGTTVLSGRVRMKDGSLPRVLEPLANINAFARVILLEGDANRCEGGPNDGQVCITNSDCIEGACNQVVIQEVFVNNFGEYLLPQVPGDRAIILRAAIEGASSDQAIHPLANLAGAPFQSIDLYIDNTPPRLDPLVVTDVSGRRVRTASPGSSVQLTGPSSDADGDPLRFLWLPSAGSGTVNAPDILMVTWTLPDAPGRYSVTLFVYDGKGGYAQSTLSLLADNEGIPFSGTVDATDAPSLVGAEVDINGQLAITGTEGVFQVRVKDADRFVLNIRKPGYALVSRIYDDAMTGGRWTMTRASVTNRDPTLDIDVTDQRDQRNCPGPRAFQLDWENYPQLAQPQWQDGQGNLAEPSGELQVPLPGLAKAPPKQCGPGIRVQFPANSLEDASGKAPSGNVDVALGTIDLMTPEQMPGDYIVRMANGETRVMQSYGAGSIEISAGGTRYNLKPGMAATLVIPVDPSQLTAGGTLPPTIPLLSYEEQQGVWVQEGEAALVGNAYMASVTHFSAFNAGAVVVAPSCVRVYSPKLPAAYFLEVYVPMGSGAAVKILTTLIDNSSPSRHVVYGLPSNTNIVLVPIRADFVDLGLGFFLKTIPFGTFVVNTGDPQTPPTPNVPVEPYNACRALVWLVDDAVPGPTPPGAFLSGQSSFGAINISELKKATSPDTDLITKLKQASIDYYKQIDPRDKRPNLDKFIEVNRFPSGEIHAVYANSGDLGFGRDMHCRTTAVNDPLDDEDDEVACYVTNYGSLGTPDIADALAAGKRELGSRGATVAMEYSRIESPRGSPIEFDDPERVVKFYVYDPTGTKQLYSADLDDLGERPVPQLCMVCHGGTYPSPPPLGNRVPSFGERKDVKFDSQFLPFDLKFFTFADDRVPPRFDKATQQDKFKRLNEEIVKNAPPVASHKAIQDIIDAMYTSGATQNEELIVSGWEKTPPEPLHIQEKMYRDVIARACRTCHAANSYEGLRFDKEYDILKRLGGVENRVCFEYVMPHAKATHDLFWSSVNPHMPAVLQVFGDAFATDPRAEERGWRGTSCGRYSRESDDAVIPSGDLVPSFYNTTIQPIFTTMCTSCHISADPRIPDLSHGKSYKNLVNVRSTAMPTMNRVTPNCTAESFLVYKIEGTQNDACDPTSVPCGPVLECVPRFRGARMPYSCSADTSRCLNDTEINNIKQWIRDGAKP